MKALQQLLDKVRTLVTSREDVKFSVRKAAAEKAKPVDDSLAATRSALAAAHAADLRRRIEVVEGQLAAQRNAVSTERAARVEAEVKSFLKSYDSRMSGPLRSTVEDLYRGAKLGVITLRREVSGVPKSAPESERFETLTAEVSGGAAAIIAANVEQLVACLHPNCAAILNFDAYRSQNIAARGKGH